MSKDRREQIYQNLIAKETDYLLEIWQNLDPSQWEAEVPEILKEILSARLGYVPPQSIETQLTSILELAEQYLEADELEAALHECERAIQIKPDSAEAHNLRGIIYDELEQLDNAMRNYQEAIQLDPDYKDAWANMLSLEAVMEEEFTESATKQHLDRALDYAYNDEPELAVEECETAKQTLPGIAAAYNYLGLILQIIDQLEPAMDAYRKASQLNPGFTAAHENLVTANLHWEEEQYHLYSNLSPQEPQPDSLDLDESQIAEIIKQGEPIPGWLYLDEKAFVLTGWAGNRNRPGRSGYDPLDTYYELAHIEGVIIRWALTGKFILRNPIYLIMMTFVGLVLGLPLFAILPFFLNPKDVDLLWIFIISSPSWIVGITLLVNVILSCLSFFLSRFIKPLPFPF